MILKRLSLEIMEGGFNGIAGVTGSGKSTIIQLILRYYDNY
jgi:ABC-type multidrug transport system fused ATPase/permease subunit